jgi:predicted nucleic acid-binding protein
VAAQTKATAIEDYSFRASDMLVLDANVWLMIYCPHGDPTDYRVRVYSDGFKRMLSAQSGIHIDSIILSEFINRYSRLVHALLKDKGQAHVDFKRFRSSRTFKPVATAITDAVRKILKSARRIDDQFGTIDIANVLSSYETGPNDFGDLLIAEHCHRGGFLLVTDDRDFLDHNINMLAARDRLF